MINFHLSREAHGNEQRARAARWARAAEATMKVRKFRDM